MHEGRNATSVGHLSDEVRLTHGKKEAYTNILGTRSRLDVLDETQKVSVALNYMQSVRYCQSAKEANLKRQDVFETLFYDCGNVLIRECWQKILATVMETYFDLDPKSLFEVPTTPPAAKTDARAVRAKMDESFKRFVTNYNALKDKRRGTPTMAQPALEAFELCWDVPVLVGAAARERLVRRTVEYAADPTRTLTQDYSHKDFEKKTQHSPEALKIGTMCRKAASFLDHERAAVECAGLEGFSYLHAQYAFLLLFGLDESTQAYLSRFCDPMKFEGFPRYVKLLLKEVENLPFNASSASNLINDVVTAAKEYYYNGTVKPSLYLAFYKHR